MRVRARIASVCSRGRGQSLSCRLCTSIYLRRPTPRIHHRNEARLRPTLLRSRARCRRLAILSSNSPIGMRGIIIQGVGQRLRSYQTGRLRLPRRKTIRTISRTCAFLPRPIRPTTSLTITTPTAIITALLGTDTPRVRICKSTSRCSSAVCRRTTRTISLTPRASTTSRTSVRTGRAPGPTRVRVPGAGRTSLSSVKPSSPPPPHCTPTIGAPRSPRSSNISSMCGERARSAERWRGM